MSEHSHEKQHAPTQNRLQRAHEEGTFARSGQLASLLFCCGAIAILMLLGQGLVKQLMEVTGSQFARAPNIAGSDLVAESSRGLWQSLNGLAPVLAMFICLAYLVHAWQSGFRIFPNRLAIDMSRIHPARGFQKLYSARKVWQSLGGIVRWISVLGVCLYLIWSLKERLILQAFQSQAEFANNAIEIGLWVFGGVFAVMLVFAVIDYMYQVATHHRDLRLSDREFRDELKSVEADPQIRSRQESRRKAMLAARLAIASATSADLVLVNRGGDVVALKLDSQQKYLATLIGKGNGALGRRIQEAAQRAGVRIIANERATSTIFQHIDIKAIVPAHLFALVK